MACETCDHTMQCVADHVFWCPRCGTLLMHRKTDEVPRDFYTPKLVPRVRRFLEITENGMFALYSPERVEQIFRTMRESVGPVAPTTLKDDGDATNY